MLDISRVDKGSIVRGLVEEQRFDKTFKHCRNLANRHEKGYSWEYNVLMKTVLDDSRGKLKLVVVPQMKWKEILDVAHDKSGHLGHRMVIAMIAKRFHWPFMIREVIAHCKSCITCA